MLLVNQNNYQQILFWAEYVVEQNASSYWKLSNPNESTSLISLPVSINHFCKHGQWIVIEYEIINGKRMIIDIKLLPLFIDTHKLYSCLANSFSAYQKIEKLWCYLADIQDTSLQRFYYDVLDNDALIHPFCYAKASLDFHHNYLGGLFEHSIEVAETVLLICHRLGIHHTHRDIALLGGLFHDLGKINMFYNAQDGVRAQHENLNFILLAKPLEKLKQRNPLQFEALSSCLSLHSNEKKDPYCIASIVKAADKISAEINQFNNAFENTPEHYSFTKNLDGRFYKRLK